MTGGGKFFRSLMLAAIGACLICPQNADAADKVTFVTDFGYNGRHAYYFVALEKGYYAKQNLDVQIVRGQGSADAVKQVAAGSAQINFSAVSNRTSGSVGSRTPTSTGPVRAGCRPAMSRSEREPSARSMVSIRKVR